MVSEDTPPHLFAELLEAPLDAEIEARIAAMRVQSNAYLDAALG